MQVIHKTIGGLLEEMAAAYPQQDAVIHSEMGVRYHFKRLSREIDRSARGFIKLGINAGDKVGLWAHNTPEWLLSFLGITKIGAITVPIDPNATTCRKQKNRGNGAGRKEADARFAVYYCAG
jgi:fatty-acyl-CoA synthase